MASIEPNKESLKAAFFRRIPKARKHNPVFQGIFELMYEAYVEARPGTKVLNIYSSEDFSGAREEVYRQEFFANCDYEAIDFWKDRFTSQDDGRPHQLSYKTDEFNVLVTTKVILEHISEPEHIIKEFFRVLKPGGLAFVVAPLVRRQHQKPYDYFRFTEFGLEYLFRKAGFTEIRLTPTNGGIYTLASYAYFFQRELPLPRWVARMCDWLNYWLIEPAAFFLDRFDNGYGRDLSLYFLV